MMNEIIWKWIGTFAFLTAWILVMVYPTQVNIRYVVTMYTVVLIIFRWIDTPQSDSALQSNIKHTG